MKNFSKTITITKSVSIDDEKARKALIEYMPTYIKRYGDTGFNTFYDRVQDILYMYETYDSNNADDKCDQAAEVITDNLIKFEKQLAKDVYEQYKIESKKMETTIEQREPATIEWSVKGTIDRTKLQKEGKACIDEYIEDCIKDGTTPSWDDFWDDYSDYLYEQCVQVNTDVDNSFGQLDAFYGQLDEIMDDDLYPFFDFMCKRKF